MCRTTAQLCGEASCYIFVNCKKHRCSILKLDDTL